MSLRMAMPPLAGPSRKTITRLGREGTPVARRRVDARRSADKRSVREPAYRRPAPEARSARAELGPRRGSRCGGRPAVRPRRLATGRGAAGPPRETRSTADARYRSCLTLAAFLPAALAVQH